MDLKTDNGVVCYVYYFTAALRLTLSVKLGDALDTLGTIFDA